MPGLTESIEYLDRTGEFPPWLNGARVLAPEPQALPKRDTRYMTLAEELDFIVGPGNDPFERVVNGRYDNICGDDEGIRSSFPERSRSSPGLWVLARLVTGGVGWFALRFRSAWCWLSCFLFWFPVVTNAESLPPP